MLEFPKELYSKTAHFIQWIIYNPLLWQDLSNSTIIPEELMIDEMTIELGKFMMMGEQNYYLDPSPIRMYGNQRILIDKDDIRNLASNRFLRLQKIANSEEAEIGVNLEYRGIDIILLQYIKDWEKIFCYASIDNKSLYKFREYFNSENIIVSEDNQNGIQLF